MKYKARYILMAAALLPTCSVVAQHSVEDKFSIKATADIGLVNVRDIDYALNDISTKSSSSDFGVDFGWTFWQQRKNSLEANIGVGYARTSLKANLPELDYHYSAPAAADMDGEPYIRYYRINGLHQKIITERLTVPIYLNYRHKLSRIFSLNAFVGVKLGFNVSSKIADASGQAFSYGVYPQYDNLMIDAPYMNQFGESVLESGQGVKPDVTSVTASFLTGIGAEVQIWGPVSVNVSIRYEAAMSNAFDGVESKLTSFTAENVPVKYTVAEGQKMMPLSNYFTCSKLSRLSCGISLIYRF